MDLNVLVSELLIEILKVANRVVKCGLPLSLKMLDWDRGYKDVEIRRLSLMHAAGSGLDGLFIFFFRCFQGA